MTSKAPILARIRDVIHRPPLGDRISHWIGALRIQLERLQTSISDLESREKILYQQCMEAMRRGEKDQAAGFGNECVQVRWFVKTATQSQLILEKAIVRLEVIREYWDLARTLQPVRLLVHKARRELEGPLPKISWGLVSVENSVNETVMSFKQAADSQSMMRVDEESSTLLDEARTIAESRVSARFPSLPEEFIGSSG